MSTNTLYKGKIIMRAQSDVSHEALQSKCSIVLYLGLDVGYLEKRLHSKPEQQAVQFRLVAGE